LKLDREITKFEQTIIGNSEAILKVRETSHKLAQSLSLTTLVIGESGTGKEMIARLIHNISNFAHQPFVDINCGAIPETLLESELFGYEKGAFTGAYKRKLGLFELGNGGTIFLDEIGNTSANFQIKLLKVVENKRFRRIGGVEEINVSTRIIAATNVDLYQRVKAGKFREDLYYRLNVYQITLPPLRKREGDAVLLAETFINYYNHEYSRKIKGLAKSAKDLIKSYPWPGNIRQLKNAIERAVLVESEDWIEADHLLLDSPRNRGKDKQKKQKNEDRINTDLHQFEIPDEGISLEEIEKKIIMSALMKGNGNLSHTARLLKINRGKLRYRLDKLGIRAADLVKFKTDAFNTIYN
jgi:transcriptional regulator with PAS, ATPase and Fis domain